MIIYHITTQTDWEAAQKNGFYEAASLADEGFIHCSHDHQVSGVLERYYAGKTNLVKLVIDADKLNQRLQHDFSPTMNESFPHVYGRINLEAVTEVVGL
ncbi:DUF952 domain-containing protein [Foetidibacter luteolus]|uniref:DUF952 domain-containing protein n=1 Tax=Foetidibacter luteolus TaxID=2608880 RepID=UPI00129A9795|nr:DUF952 domain-containing protein [Foetidibacter luteolus]